MPNALFYSLLGFGMYTLRTGIGSKVVALSASLRRVRFPSGSPLKLLIVTPSIPAVSRPWLVLTE
jgi:hypothetical protein